MRVYIAIYDDRVAGAFDDFDKCMTFIRSRALDESHHFNIMKGFTRFEYDDERGNHHIFYETDHEIK